MALHYYSLCSIQFIIPLRTESVSQLSFSVNPSTFHGNYTTYFTFNSGDNVLVVAPATIFGESLSTFFSVIIVRPQEAASPIWRQFIELNGLLSVASCCSTAIHSGDELPIFLLWATHIYEFCQPLSRCLLSIYLGSPL